MSFKKTNIYEGVNLPVKVLTYGIFAGLFILGLVIFLSASL